MDFIGPELPEQVERYLSQYDALFKRPEQRRQLRFYIAGLLSETHRKNIASIAAKVVEGSYSAGHHFLADAPWDRESVNKRRLELVQQDPAMQMSPQGWFIQDDTGQVRRFWSASSGRYGTDGVARQYIGNVGKVAEGLVFVSTQYADGKKQIPITADLYWAQAALDKLPDEEQTVSRKRDKIQIALDQVRWIEKNLPDPKPRRVIVDPWYGSNSKYLKTLQNELNWKYVASIRSNVKLFISLPGERGHPAHSAREILGTLLKTEDFQPVSVQRADGSSEIKWAASLSHVKLKRIGYVAHLVVQVDDPHRLNADEAEFMLCNDESMTLAEIVRARALRNEIEVFYEDAKDDMGLDQAEVRREERLLRHWTLVMVLHTMLETFRQRGDLSGWTRRPLKTRGDILRLIRDIFRWEFWMVWIQRVDNLKRFVEWFCTSRGLRVQWQEPITLLVS